MRIFPGKTHHFTKWELAAGETAIIVIICVMLTAACLAAPALLPIRVKIVQCGARADLPAKCREEQHCCALLEQGGGSRSTPAAHKKFYESSVTEPSADLTLPEENHAIDE